MWKADDKLNEFKLLGQRLGVVPGLAFPGLLQEQSRGGSARAALGQPANAAGRFLARLSVVPPRVAPSQVRTGQQVRLPGFSVRAGSSPLNLFSFSLIPPHTLAGDN